MYQIVDQPGDGSCFYHSFLYAINEEFRQMSYQTKKKIIQNIRNYFSDSFEEDLLPIAIFEHMKENLKEEFYTKAYNKLFRRKTEDEIRGMFENIGINIGNDWGEFERKRLTVDMLSLLLYNRVIDWNEHAINEEKKLIKTYTTFVDDISILITLCYYKKNLILLRHGTREVYYKKIINKNYKFVVLDYQQDYHYELLARKIGENLMQYTFNKNDPFIEDLLGPYE